ncbi:hypothetical protein F7Q99_04760 [Streptomyces kaniharaensis]|uniref:Uncharacterized protein n=1 Tax=Streptomyces kaniharaensis TaxID=212423 RepID=A0A6N7KLH5_9ACTN|nr:hypothetical protein [Streptomyces kaniharaensis]MQS11615.1 hypothetical protein [Streptomyces kaniharaensis]
MGNPDFTTGPVTPAPTPGTTGGSPYAKPVHGGGAPWGAAPPGMATIHLDTPHELAASAGIARQIATDLNRANGSAGPNLRSLDEYASTASVRIRGFAFGGALTGSTERWMKQCKALHDKLAGVAADLDRTHREYSVNDAKTSASFGADRVGADRIGAGR